MTAAAAAAGVGEVVKTLSVERVKAYVSSSELGPIFVDIETELKNIQELLNEAQERGISNKPGGLQEPLKKLSEKAGELNNFIKKAAPDVGTSGNNDKPRGTKRPKLSFDKIKPVIRELRSLCARVSNLLKINLKLGEAASLTKEGNKLTIERRPLNFHDLDKVEEMTIRRASNISLTDLQMLKSLRKLCVVGCDSMFSGDAVVLRSIRSLSLVCVRPNGELLSKVFNCFPALSELNIDVSFEDNASFESFEELVLQFPCSSSLRVVRIKNCKKLTLPVGGGGELRELTLLRSLKIDDCGDIFSRWTMGEAAQIIMPFPASLRELSICKESSMRSMALLSNLTSLTLLELIDCDNLTKDGFNPLITSNLKLLKVYNKSETCSIAADLLSEVARTRIIPAGSFLLEELEVDSISAVLVAPICSHLSATLHKLTFWYDQRAESFTEEQEKALQLLTSLKDLEFDECRSLQSLPEGLHLLSSLKHLNIWSCPQIRSLSEEDVPTSLGELCICDISDDLKVQIEKLKETLPDLHVISF